MSSCNGGGLQNGLVLPRGKTNEMKKGGEHKAEMRCGTTGPAHAGDTIEQPNVRFIVVVRLARGPLHFIPFPSPVCHVSISPIFGLHHTMPQNQRAKRGE